MCASVGTCRGCREAGDRGSPRALPPRSGLTDSDSDAERESPPRAWAVREPPSSPGLVPGSADTLPGGCTEKSPARNKHTHRSATAEHGQASADGGFLRDLSLGQLLHPSTWGPRPRRYLGARSGPAHGRGLVPAGPRGTSQQGRWLREHRQQAPAKAEGWRVLAATPGLSPA